MLINLLNNDTYDYRLSDIYQDESRFFFGSVLKDRVTILGGEYRLRAARQRGPLFIEAPVSQKWAQSWKSVRHLCFEEKRKNTSFMSRLNNNPPELAHSLLFMVHTLDSIAQGFP